MCFSSGLQLNRQSVLPDPGSPTLAYPLSSRLKPVVNCCKFDPSEFTTHIWVVPDRSEQKAILSLKGDQAGEKSQVEAVSEIRTAG